MRENRTCGSEGGAAELNRSFLPLSGRREVAILKLGAKRGQGQFRRDTINGKWHGLPARGRGEQVGKRRR
jgi:hypothetical protein